MEAELEVAVGYSIGHFPTNLPHLGKQIQFARPNLLYISNGEPMIVYCNVPTFKEQLTNFKLLFQAPYKYYHICHDSDTSS